MDRKWALGSWVSEGGPGVPLVRMQDRVGTTVNLCIRGQLIERVDKFIYLGSHINPGSDISEELSLRIKKVQLSFTDLYRLER